MSVESIAAIQVLVTFLAIRVEGVEGFRLNCTRLHSSDILFAIILFVQVVIPKPLLVGQCIRSVTLPGTGETLVIILFNIF